MTWQASTLGEDWSAPARAGVAGYRKNTHDFNKLIWKTASPKWDFADVTHDRTASAFTNPDHVAVAVHSYRWRLSLAPQTLGISLPGVRGMVPIRKSSLAGGCQDWQASALRNRIRARSLGLVGVVIEIGCRSVGHVVVAMHSDDEEELRRLKGPSAHWADDLTL